MKNTYFIVLLRAEINNLLGRTNTDTHKWDLITLNVCPNCGKKHTMVEIANGGLAVNIQCDSCQQKYWITYHREFGAIEIQ